MPTATLGQSRRRGASSSRPCRTSSPRFAIAIVAGATLGRQSGFMVGAIAALVSNFFFGQGAWTPMQMYSWGLVGYLAGVLADVGAFRHGWVLYAYGFASVLLYGLLLNGWYVLGYVRPLTWGPILTAFALGLPLDVTHSIATVGFLAAIWLPWEGPFGASWQSTAFASRCLPRQSAATPSGVHSHTAPTPMPARIVR